MASQHAFVQRIGPFTVEGILGSGGMGIVYRAIAENGARVALKVLSLRSTAEAVQRFGREARLSIDHPNIVRTIDAQLDPNGVSWIAFELLEGRSLERDLAVGPL